MPVKTRLIALCAVVALMAAACGSRLSDGELAAGGGTGGGTGNGQTANGGPPGTGTDPTMFGTLKTPCGPAPEGGVKSVQGVPGVTDTEIKIAVISDKAGVVKVPTISVEESMKAFVLYCNGLGGINGRKLSLATYDAKLTADDVAAKAACAAKPFAVVGSGAVSDDQGAQILVDCGVVNVPAYTATAKQALADNMIQPLPNPSNLFNTSPARWIKEQYPDAVTKAAILASDLPTATTQADRIEKAYDSVGFDFTYRKNTGIIMTSYSAEASEMKSKGIEYVTMVSATSETTKLLKDMKTLNWRPEVIDLGQQYYDRDLLTEKGAEGALVQTNTMPFEEADDVPALKQFLAEYDKVGTKIQPASLGVQAFSAGLLFATATKNAGDDLSRERVLAELRKIHEWDGGGLHFKSDPGNNAASTCFLYMKVQDGKFVREFPKKVGTFQCEGKDVVYDLKSNYGGGAKAKGK